MEDDITTDDVTVSAYDPTTAELEERIELVLAICKEAEGNEITLGEGAVRLAKKISRVLRPLLPQILAGLDNLEKLHQAGDVAEYHTALLQFCEATGQNRFEVEKELDRRARLRAEK